MTPTRESRSGMPVRSLRTFLAWTFGVTWGLAFLLVLVPDHIEAIFGELRLTNPLFLLAVYSPGFAGVVLVWRHYGAKGLGSYLRRLTRWRMPLGWWVFLVAGVPLLFYAVVAISVIVTPMFNAARGSLLIAVLFHFQVNGPAWPDAQPWDTLVFVAAAVIVVVVNRKSMLGRDGAVTDILVPVESPARSPSAGPRS